MEIKEVASSPFLYATVASLAVLIIGAIAYQKIGLLSNCAPVTGIVMMSVGASVLFFEGIIWSYQRFNHSNEDIQFFPPVDNEKHWTMLLPGQTKRVPFVLRANGPTISSQNQKYCAWSSQDITRNNLFCLWISTSISEVGYLIGFIYNDTIVTDQSRKERLECLKLIQDNHLQPIEIYG